MQAVGGLSILSHFEDLKDPRIERTKKHLLLDIIGLTICAVICGADGWQDIEEYGRAKIQFLKKFLALPNGIPSHDTIERLFQRIKPAAFERCFRSWTGALAEKLGLKQIAIDGKTVRGSFDRASGQSALHLVSAWSTEGHFTLGQVAVEDKSNEITAIPELLRLMEVSGAIITIDAMGCQKEVAATIQEAGGDYVLAVKENQPNLFDDILDHFLELHETDFAGAAGAKCSHFKTEKKSHGRVERRDYYSTPVPKTIRNSEAWRGLKSIGQVVSLVERDGKETSEVRLYISSLPSNARQFGKAVRGHWGIENSCHWVLDMTFHEDRSRIRKDHGAENFALLRRLSVAAIKQAKTKGSVRLHRKKAAWDDEHLLTIIANAE
jgi:predicted transposase YbfD/YdcC